MLPRCSRGGVSITSEVSPPVAISSRLQRIDLLMPYMFELYEKCLTFQVSMSYI